jgi:hypothetical protein
MMDTFKDTQSTIRQKLQAIFEEHNIYRCLMIYDDEDVYKRVKHECEEYDFTFVDDETGSGRIYGLHVDTFDSLDKPTLNYIDWNTINIVLCLGERSYEIGQYFFQANAFIDSVYIL